MLRRAFCILLILLVCSCEDEEQPLPSLYPTLMEVPVGFPPIDFPEGNEFSQERWELGKKLFYDPVMSVDSSVSCASCHHPSLSFSDNVALSLGVDDLLGTRNASPLANVAYHPYFTREGGVPSLEMQVLVPIQEHNEFAFNIVLLADKLSEDSVYVQMALDAYDRTPDPFVITRALANFERSLLSGNSRYDQHINSLAEAVLTASELRGMDLFFSERTQCSSCHGGFNFTNYAFENNGLYEEYKDIGRFRFSNEVGDSSLFKVPSLRNVSLTAPYMHDGSMADLETVVAHYVSGGKDYSNKSELIRPLDLTLDEQTDLRRFLESLTDDEFVDNPIFR